MIFVSILFVILGLLIKHAKMHFLIAGYNIMPKTKREQFNIEGISTMIRNVFFMMAIVVIIGHFTAKAIDRPELESVPLSLAIIIGLPYLLIKLNSRKFQLNVPVENDEIIK